MTKIISVHSFRGGTGKSNTTANLAALLAMEGKRVGVVDTDINSPGIHILFGLDENEMGNSLNDYLWGKCEIQDCAQDVTGRLDAEVKGQVFLIPSSIKAGEIARILREGYDVGLLTDGFRDLGEKLDLDYLLIDTHPGLNEETLLSIAISHSLIIIMRPDSQDYQGTIVTVDVARKLEVPNMMMIVNKTPKSVDMDDLRGRVEKIYQCDVVAIIPHSDEMMILASAGIFALKFDDHPVTKEFKNVVAKVSA